VQQNEVDNAFNQAQKELAQRFDFKDTETTMERAPDAITIHSSAEDRAKAALTVLQDKLVKRKVSLRFTDPQKPEKTAKGGARIVVKIKEGIEIEKAPSCRPSRSPSSRCRRRSRRARCASPARTRTTCRPS
jgi:hypothetical protein